MASPLYLRRNISLTESRSSRGYDPVYRIGIGPFPNHFTDTVDIIRDDTIVVLLHVACVVQDNFLDRWS